MLTIFQVIDFLAVFSHPNSEFGVTGIQNAAHYAQNKKMVIENQLFHTVKVRRK